MWMDVNLLMMDTITLTAESKRGNGTLQCTIMLKEQWELWHHRFRNFASHFFQIQIF